MDIIDRAIAQNLDVAIQKLTVAKQFISMDPVSAYELLKGVSRELSQAEVTLYNIITKGKNGRGVSNKTISYERDEVCLENQK